MTPKELLERGRLETFQDAAGHRGKIELRPPLTVEELAVFQEHLPAPLPDDIREVLRFARGFTLLRELVDFRGQLRSEFEPALSCGIPIYTDGVGNFWMVQVHSKTGAWAPVLFSSADPPAVVIQSADLVTFLEEWFNGFRPGRASALDQVYRVALDVWHQKRGVRRVAEVRNSPDAILRSFAQSLKDDDYLADLRGGTVGCGFTWGRFGSEPAAAPAGSDLLFAIEMPRRKGFFARLLRG